MENSIPWDLIISKLRRDNVPEEETLFKAWLEQGNNRRLFHQIETVWINVREKAAIYEPDVEYYWKELSARIADSAKSRRRKRFSLQPVYRKVAAVAAIFLLFLGTGLFYYITNAPGSEAVSQTSLSVTKKSKAFLPDGSEIWLNTNSTLTYAENSSSRNIEMDGEAYFSVSRDEKRPFIVTTNGVAIKVHGTQFNVNSYATSGDVLVSLYEGSVSMKSGGQRVFLKPGEEGHFDRQNKKINVEKGDVEMAKIWTKDKIRFENKNLREVCRYLSKWYKVEIIIDPAIPDDQSYTFTLKNQSLEEVVQIMSSINSIDYSFSDNNKVLTIK